MKPHQILSSVIFAGLAASSQAAVIANAAADYTVGAPSHGWAYLRSTTANGTGTALTFVGALPSGGGMTLNPAYTGNAGRANSAAARDRRQCERHS